MARRVPARLQWAVEVLAVQPDENILEIGCGRGAAMELLCARLQGGQITGVDRSATATTAAKARNLACIQAGRARVLATSLAELDLNEQFNKIFAVNVNVFWLGPAQELAVTRRLLVPSGKLCLFYEPPSTSQLTRTRESGTLFLNQSDYSVLEVIQTDLPPNLGLCIIAQPAPTQ